MSHHQSRPPFVWLCYRSPGVGVSHIGLGVSSLTTCKVLRKNDIAAEVDAIGSANELEEKLRAAHVRPTHVVMGALWLKTAELKHLCRLFRDIKFIVCCHSNLGFLQAEPAAINLMREQSSLEVHNHNFHLAANCETLSEYWSQVFGPCAYLPNLYAISKHEHGGARPTWGQTGGILKIGIFGAIRAQKNMLTSAGAALKIARELKADTKLYVSTGRYDSNESKTIYQSIVNLTKNVPHFELTNLQWAEWDVFRRWVGSMNLLICASNTESFSMVSADAASLCVPVVVSSAIDWAPPSWVADADDVEDIVRHGMSLLHDPRAGAIGHRHLEIHNARSILAWERFLNS